METQKQIDFERISVVLDYMHKYYKEQPSLEELAKLVHLSPFHFQRLFTAWAGVSPKKYLHFISINYAKWMLRKKQNTLFDTSNKIGFSGTGRLHDLFIKIEGMTPKQYKNGGLNLNINYSFHQSIFGQILIASTIKGICYLAFVEDENIDDLKKKYPSAFYLNKTDELQENALKIFKDDWGNIEQIKLHLKGTEFQLKVWACLLSIPEGRLKSYGEIAESVGSPKASRAVGTAIGSNLVAFLIPCHRVIQKSGLMGGYRWGLAIKRAMISREGIKFFE